MSRSSSARTKWNHVINMTQVLLIKRLPERASGRLAREDEVSAEWEKKRHICYASTAAPD